MNKDKAKSEVTKQETLSFLDPILEESRNEPQSLIPVLIEVQDEVGYISPSIQETISDKLEVPFSRVHSVVTFYSYFSSTPQGDHIVGLCMGTACYAKGANDVLDQIKKQLDIEEGGTSEDGVFSLSLRRCLGACAKAPIMMIDDEVYGNLTPKKIGDILAQYR